MRNATEEMCHQPLDFILPYSCSLNFSFPNFILFSQGTLSIFYLLFPFLFIFASTHTDRKLKKHKVTAILKVLMDKELMKPTWKTKGLLDNFRDIL